MNSTLFYVVKWFDHASFMPNTTVTVLTLVFNVIIWMLILVKVVMADGKHLTKPTTIKIYQYLYQSHISTSDADRAFLSPE